MANKVEKITIQIDSSFNTNKIESSAKKIQEVLSKVGISEESNKKLRVYSATIEELSKKASEITMKGIVTEKDLKNLNLLFSQIEDNYNKISEMGSDFELPQLKIIQELNQEIKDATLKTEEAIDKIKAEFSGASKAILGKKLDFGDYENELASIDAQISKTTDEITRKNSEGQQSIDELTQKSLDSFKKGNGAKFKNLDDLVKYTESKEKEVLDIETKYGLTKEKRLREYKKAGLDNRTVSMNEDLIESQKNREKAIESINSAQAKLDISTKKEIENLKILEGRRETLATTYNETSEKIIIENKNLQNSINTREGLIDTIEDQRLAQEQQLREEIKLAQSPATEAINKNKNAISGFFKKLSEAQGLNKAIGDSFDKISAKIKNVTSAVYLLNVGWQKLKEAGSVVSNLDKQLTEIAIVTKQTTDTMWNSFDTFNKAAMSLSSTTLQYLEGAKIFYQQGLNTAEVMRMVEATTKAAALSGVSFSAASETLTAAINAYQMGASKAMEVTDKLAAVGAASASDFQELSTAMEKVASQAYSSGMSFDSLIGILAKGIETTREAPEAIGTGLKSIIARFQEMKENPMATLEDGLNANRVEKALKSVGVALRDSNGEFRNMDDVFADLGESWKTMSRNQRAYIATMAAGSRQQSRFMAIMTNYDRTLSLVRTSTNSAGAANQQYAIYTDSIEAANKRMTNSLERLYTTILSSDAIKQLYDGLSTLFQIITDLNPFAIALVGGIGLLITKITAFTAAQKILAATDIDLVKKALNPLAKGMFELFTAGKENIEITKLQTIAQNSLNASLAIGIAVIAGLVFAIVSWKKAQKDAAMAYQREASLLSEKAQSEREEAVNLKTKVERYEELSQKVNKSNEEQSEYLSLIKEISDIAPELISGIDSEGNAILARNDILKDAVKQYEADARAADIAASKARLAAQAHAEWNAAVEEGAVGPKTAESAAYIEASMKNLEKSIGGTFGQKWGGQLITSNIAKAIAKGANPKELKKYADKGISQAEFLGSILPAAGAGVGAAAGALVGASLTAPAGGEGGVLGWKIGAGVGLATGTALADTFFFSEKELAEIKKQTDSMINQYENYLKIKLAETRASISKELNVIGQTSLDAIEANGETISLGYRNVLSSMTQIASQIAVQGIEGTKEQAEAIAQNAPQIFNELMLQLESYRTKGGFQTALTEILTLKDEGASIKELQNQVQQLLNNFTIDSKSDLGKAISGSIFNQEQFKKDMSTLALSIGKDLDQTFINQLEGTFSNFSSKLKDYFLTTFDSIESGLEKEKLLEAFSNVYDNPELAKVINSSFDKLDQTNASQMRAFTESLALNLYESGGNIYKNYQEAYNAAILAISQETQDAMAFIKIAQDTYKEISSLVELSKKATSGAFSLTDAFDYILKYGEDALDSIRIVGDQVFISYSSIEKQIREGELKLINAYESAQSSVKTQRDELIAQNEKLAKENNDLSFGKANIVGGVFTPVVKPQTPLVVKPQTNPIIPSGFAQVDKKQNEFVLGYGILSNDLQKIWDETSQNFEKNVGKINNARKTLGQAALTPQEKKALTDEEFKKNLKDLDLFIKISADANKEEQKNNEQTAKIQAENDKIRADASEKRRIENEKTISFFETISGSMDQYDAAYTDSTNRIAQSNNELGASIAIATNGERGWESQLIQSTATENELSDIRKEHIQIQKDSFEVITTNTEAIKNNNTENEKYIETNNNAIQTNDEQIRSLDAQSAAYERLLNNIKKVSMVEQARIDQQDVLTGISGVNTTLDSMKGFGDVLDKLNNDGFTFLETLQAIGDNPDLIAAIDFQNEGLEFSKQKILEIAEAKKAETIEFLTDEKTKLEAVKALIDNQLYGTAMVGKNQYDAAVQTLESYQAEGDSLNELYTSEQELQKVKLDNLNKISIATDEYYKSTVEGAKQVADANAQAWSGVPGYTGTGSAGIKDYVKTQKTIEIPKTTTIPGTNGLILTDGNLKFQNGIFAKSDVANILATKFGMDPSKFNSPEELLAEARKKIDSQITTYDQLIAKLQGTSVGTMLETASGTKKGTDSVKEANDSLEKFYNLLRQIEDAESDISTLQKRIDLRKTGASEDLKLLEEKASKTNELISLQKDLLEVRKNELQSIQDEKQAMFSSWVQIVDGNATIINQIALSKALMSGGVTQEFYDDLQKYIEEFNNLSNTIRDTESVLIDLEKQQEEMYDNIIQKAIDTRQQLYDVLVEADQKELDATKEKFDRMTEIEQKYLSAVKNAIDEERNLREDAEKEADLATKRRRIAVLQRDTSGINATEIQKLQKEIAADEQALRDSSIDKQYEALQKQITLQEEQRDSQIKLLEEQQRFREDTGYYWDRVDDAIQNGPDAMLDLLTSSKEYQTSDPLVQQNQLDEFKRSVDTLSELAQGAGNGTVISAIEAAARAIVENNIEQVNKIKDIEIAPTVSPTVPPTVPPNTPPNTPPGGQTTPIATTTTSTLKIIGTIPGTSNQIVKLSDGSVANISTAIKIPGTTTYKTTDNKLIAYADGGYVKHTGPAWVDGTLSNPEAFLNAKQTSLFENLRDLLAQTNINDILSSENQINNNISIGDIIINLQNKTSASADEIAKMVRKEIVGSYSNRIPTSIQKVR